MTEEHIDYAAIAPVPTAEKTCGCGPDCNCGPGCDCGQTGKCSPSCTCAD